MNEELRPCPFCGKSAQVSKEYEGYIFCECIDDDGSVYDDDWNSAWCWKEIDRLKAQNEKMRGALEKISVKLCDCANPKWPIEEHGMRCSKRIAEVALKGE